MSERKLIVASIINYLKRQLEDTSLSADGRESVEVSVQCLESAFGITGDENTVDLVQLVRDRDTSPNTREEAERLKTEGNQLMKNDQYADALRLYSRAIALDPTNAVYFCNRAAAHFKLNDHEAAVADCTAALALQPDYSKAHGRLGLAFAAMDRHREARAAFARAAALEPDNETYRSNVALAEERLASTGNQPDLASLLQNGSLLTMATDMLADPNMQMLISGMMAGRPAEPGGTGITALLEAGQVLAQRMQASHPELVQQLRQQINRDHPGQQGAPPTADPNAAPHDTTPQNPPRDPNTQ